MRWRKTLRITRAIPHCRSLGPELEELGKGICGAFFQNKLTSFYLIFTRKSQNYWLPISNVHFMLQLHLATGIPNRAWQAAEAATFPTLTWSLTFSPTSGSMRWMRDRFGVTRKDPELQGARYVHRATTGSADNAQS